MCIWAVPPKYPQYLYLWAKITFFFKLFFSTHNQVHVCFLLSWTGGLTEVFQKLVCISAYKLCKLEILILPEFSSIKQHGINYTQCMIRTLHKHNKKAQYTHSDGQNCLAFIPHNYFSWPNYAHAIHEQKRTWQSCRFCMALTYHKGDSNSSSSTRLGNNQPGMSFLMPDQELLLSSLFLVIGWT